MPISVDRAIKKTTCINIYIARGGSRLPIWNRCHEIKKFSPTFGNLIYLKTFPENFFEIWPFSHLSPYFLWSKVKELFCHVEIGAVNTFISVYSLFILYEGKVFEWGLLKMHHRSRLKAHFKWNKQTDSLPPTGSSSQWFLRRKWVISISWME